MTEKLLYYIDKAFVHFGIANSIPKKISCEQYAIYDLNYIQKTSFQKQNFVPFVKQWFLQDSIILNENPDLDYLKTYDDILDTNLWTLAFSERLFRNYNKYYRFSDKQILSIFEQELKFFNKILDEVNPDYLLIRTTDWHRNHILTELCNSRNIPVLMLNQTRFGKRTSISSQFDELDFIDENKIPSTNKFNLDEYIKKFNKRQDVVKNEFKGTNISIFTKIKLFVVYMSMLRNKKYQNFYENFGRSPLNIIIKELPIIIKKKIRERFMDHFFDISIPAGYPYAYFALHYEPERTLLIDSPGYSNQIEIISQVARSLPVNFKLFVKEHIGMRVRGWRNISFYKKLLAIPNVRLIHPCVDSDEIIQKSSLVITINGTTGLEGVFHKKPVIIFNHTSYVGLPFVTQVTDFSKLPEIIRSSLKFKVDYTGLTEYVQLMNYNSFEFDMKGFHKEIFNEFFYNSFFMESEIPLERIKSFIEKHSDKFELLSTEYIKKIQQLKSNKR